MQRGLRGVSRGMRLQNCGSSGSSGLLSATCRAFHTCRGLSPCLRCLLCPHRSGMMAAPSLEALLWGAEGGSRLRAPVRGSPELWKVTLAQPASTSGPAGSWQGEPGLQRGPECPGPRRAGCQGSAFSRLRGGEASFLFLPSCFSPAGRPLFG